MLLFWLPLFIMDTLSIDGIVIFVMSEIALYCDMRCEIVDLKRNMQILINIRQRFVVVSYFMIPNVNAVGYNHAPLLPCLYTC